MSTELEQKNKFIHSLIEHLKSKYHTEHHYTCGEGNFKGQKIGGAYCLVRKDPNKLKEISAFYFRKNLCSCAPQNVSVVLKDIHNFSVREKSLESVFGEDGKKLTILFGYKKYMVTSYIDEGYAGEINVSFMELSSIL
jgi:hypothetical protein